MISNSPSFWASAWGPYESTVTWKLTPGDGPKTVYVRFRDRAENGSLVYSATVIVDTKAPTGKVLINNNAVSAVSSKVTLNLTGVDVNGISYVMIGNTADLKGAAWVPYATTKSCDLTAGKGIKNVYVKYMDKAGNVSPVYSDTIIIK